MSLVDRKWISPQRQFNTDVTTFYRAGSSRRSLVKSLKKIVLSALRGLAVAFILLVALIHSLSLEIQLPRRWRIRGSRAVLAHTYSKWILYLLGRRNEKFGPLNVNSNGILQARPQTILCILKLSSQQPTNFVVSEDWRERPIIGLLCILSGCLFLHRKGSWHYSRDLEEIQVGRLKGLHLVELVILQSRNGLYI